MFDRQIFQEILSQYKKDFPGQWWTDEKYKWEMVQWFQQYWDIEAEDFAAMLTKAMKKTDNLLASRGRFPLQMLQKIIEVEPEKVRDLFRNLYDESKDYAERVEEFKIKINELFVDCINNGQLAVNHQNYSTHQDENSISVYLWLRYPGRYYIYKFSEAKCLEETLHGSYLIKMGAFVENLRGNHSLCNEISEVLRGDEEIQQILREQLTEECWPDEALHILTSDLSYYVYDKTVKAKKRAEKEKEAAGEPENEQETTETREIVQPAPAEAHVLKEDASVSAEPALPAYGREDFLSEVYMDGAAYDRLAALVRRKKNVILEGAPGVGKTFAARRLAWALMGEKDDSRIELVQFHQSYSYEDFILGYKPDGAGFALKEGVFYQFCERAAARSQEDFFFLIDEINRGNLSRIFGEMLMAVEREYRGTAVRLPEGDWLFSVPENVYLIGMMNTADRSLALMDYALRRRFGFFEMRPGFDSEGFRAYEEKLNRPKFDAIIRAVKELNQAIADDPALGRGFCIGHSYFCGGDGTDEWMESVVEYDLLPTLDEYWYDEEDTRRRWAQRLREAVHGAE